jgi:hypothetical protein
MAKKNKGKSTKAVPVQFDPAEEVEKIAKKLIPKYHSHLATCKIAYLYKNKTMKSKGVEVAATAEKISKKHHVLSGYHFLITTAYPTWKELSDKQKLAVVDHELEHCFVEDDEKTGEPKYSILPHDVEEFGSIIKRHGLYTTNLVRIGRVVEDALENLEKKTVVKKVGKPDEEEVEDVEDDEEEEAADDEDDDDDDDYDALEDDDDDEFIGDEA